MRQEAEAAYSTGYAEANPIVLEDGGALDLGTELDQALIDMTALIDHLWHAAGRRSRPVSPPWPQAAHLPPLVLPAVSAVKDRLTPDRRPRPVENDEYSAFSREVLCSYARYGPLLPARAALWERPCCRCCPSCS